MTDKYAEFLSLFGRGSGRFSEISEDFFIQWSRMEQFRSLLKLGLPSVEAAYSKQLLSLFQEMRKGKQFEKLLVDGEKFFAEGRDRTLSIEGAREAVEYSLAVGESLVLIWGHSIVENALYGFIQLSSMLDPNRYFEVIKKRTSTIEELRGKHFDEIVRNSVQKYVLDLERESLVRKSRELKLALQEAISQFPHGKFTYDEVRLNEIDRRRHDVAHGRNTTLMTSQVDVDLDYLLGLHGFHLFLMAVGLGVKIAPTSDITKVLIARDKLSNT